MVGLGNPGSSYERTRHNVGFRFVERLAEGEIPWRDFDGSGLVSRWGEIYLAKPTTFMNDSGRFVRAFCDYHRIAAGDALVVFDELALPIGKIRIRRRGSSGGQKGMLSIIEHFGTEEIPRLRIGIGPQPEKMDAADFVLGRFSKADEKPLEDAFIKAESAVSAINSDGIEAAMNIYNAAEGPKP